jgi:hypothetical protein
VKVAVALCYGWMAQGLELINERSKGDCDGVFVDAWIKWPQMKAGRRQP